jgi:hypothetical protein
MGRVCGEGGWGWGMVIKISPFQFLWGLDYPILVLQWRNSLGELGIGSPLPSLLTTYLTPYFKFYFVNNGVYSANQCFA